MEKVIIIDSDDNKRKAKFHKWVVLSQCHVIGIVEQNNGDILLIPYNRIRFEREGDGR